MDFSPQEISELGFMAIAAFILLVTIILILLRPKRDADKEKLKHSQEAAQIAETMHKIARSARFLGFVLIPFAPYSYFFALKTNSSLAWMPASAIFLEALILLMMASLIPKRSLAIALPYVLSVVMIIAVPIVAQVDYLIPVFMFFIIWPLGMGVVLLRAWRLGYFSPQKEKQGMD